jgi:pimeloyl-ACP methyl ester carboxylesterase
MNQRMTSTRSVPGATLHLTEQGQGDPLLLLHGLCGTGDDWAHVFDLQQLAQRYRVLCPDARGHGRSGGSGGEFGLRRCALDVLALLDQLGLPRVRALGMSLGAKTLLHVVSLAPDRISRMVLVSPAPRWPEATLALFRAAAAAPHSEAEWRAMRALHVQGDAQIAALWRLPALLAEQAHELAFTAAELQQIETECLIVSGDRDPIYPVELSLELSRGLSRAQLCVVPGGGHGPIFEPRQRDNFVSLALSFLETD